ncbi:hypothetical protein TVAG_197420 [Trichomonas vaginalis G3]|uniref:Uncharacterized protein n=1 Tax=Trichomonas vaginalis (strain ATCC PRA-98 / G3) TaxID=412133 RepID=A2EPL2_TRIV3|nr:biological adhesion protein [Trichomonas vaginalis G3]EAY05441.1 hypothetical protein TVAG_197420 [Trichomonas vaginalis G3]KAI5523883.1 biological adhesion protein [Trichomonas vaginalis G3]|eukprot:XP_001317664.1 hypothetical protein [Trichomonas vaginalis G3]
MNSDEEYDPEQQVDEGRLQELEDKVAVLTKENEVLKAQFNQAITLSDTLKAVTAKSEDQQQKIRSLSLENEDLNHRIEILSKQLEESNQKLADQRKAHDEQRQIDQKDLNGEIDRVKSELNQTIEKLSKDLDDAVSDKDSLESEIKLLKTKNQNVISAANYSFSEDFSSIEDVITYLEERKDSDAKAGSPKKAEGSPKKSPTKTPISQPAPDVANMKNKLRSLSNKNKQLMDTCVSLEEQLNIAQRKLKEQESKYTIQIKQYEQKLKATQEEASQQQQDQKQTITTLENKIDALKSDIANTRSALHESTVINIPNEGSILNSPKPTNTTPKRTPVTSRSVTIAQPEPSTTSRVSQRTAADQELDHLNTRNSELTAELQLVNAKKDDLQKKLAEASQARQQLELNVSKQKVTFDALTTVHSETVLELETVRKTLSNLSPLKENPEKTQKKEQDQFKKKINLLEQTISEQKKQISAAINEAISTKGELARLSAHANHLESELSRCDKQIRKLTADLTEAEHRYETKPTVTEDDILPSSAWRFSGFDTELSDQVAAIGNNEALQTSSKLRNAFKAIADYYNKNVDESDAAAFEANETLANFKSILNTFIVDLTIAYSGDAKNIDFFISDSGKTIVKEVTDLKKSFDEMRRKNNQYEQTNNLFKEMFGDDEDLTETFQNLKQTLEQRANNLESRNRRVKDLKQQLEVLQKKYQTEKSDLQADLDEKSAKLEEISANLVQATSEISSLKRRNQELTQLLREARKNNDNLQSTMMAEQENAAQSTADEITRLDQSLRAEIRQAEERLNMTESELEDAAQEIERLKQVINSQKETLLEKEAKNKDERNNMEEELANEKKHHEEEKAEIIDNYEKAIESLKENSENQRQTIEKLTNEIKTFDAKIKELQKQLSKLKRKKKTLIEEVRITKEECDRELKLSESRHISEMMKIETDCNARISKQQEQSDNEKNHLIIFAANELKSYANTNESALSERSYKQLISKAKSELDRLSKIDNAIRKMTKASDRQTTEDSVAQLLLSK